jgi:DNA ligase (polydeoxyribonucleotide synthase [ATP])
VVVAHKVGQGKFSGLLGSVVCENLSNKKRFKIGSGFSDKERANPPKIGSVITYKYQNLTAKGLPRFPVFLRVRED